MDEEMILPDDFETEFEGTETEATPQAEEMDYVDNTEATPKADVEDQQVSDFLKVKYNHEERSLTPEEAKELAQIGLFHKEKFQPQLENYKYFEDLARENDMSLPQLVEYYKSQQEQSKLSEIMDYNDVSEDVAMELLEARRLKEEFKAKEELMNKETMQREEISKFIDEFPDVSVKDIPKEVFEKTMLGVPLKYAYLEHKYAETKINNKNEMNKKSAPIRSISKNGFQDNSVADPFMEGFDF